jgi:uncharacterized membrane protein
MSKKGILILLNITLILFSWYNAYHYYQELPDKIPTHFNFEGKIDKWSQKTPVNFYALPLIQTFIFLMLWFFSNFPKLFNFPQKERVLKLSQSSREIIYEVLKEFMMIISLVINIMFFYILRAIYFSALHQKSELNPAILFAIIGLIFVATAYFLIKVGKLTSFYEKKELLQKKV